MISKELHRIFHNSFEFHLAKVETDSRLKQRPVKLGNTNVIKVRARLLMKLGTLQISFAFRFLRKIRENITQTIASTTGRASIKEFTHDEWGNASEFAHRLIVKPGALSY